MKFFYGAFNQVAKAKHLLKLFHGNNFREHNYLLNFI